MSWLSTFWKHNRDFMGNALKNIAPAAFLIPGVGPLAAAGLAGAGSALGRGIQHGGNLGNILKQGAQGAAMAYGGGQFTGKEGYHALTKLFTGGTRAGANAAANAGGQTAGEVGREAAKLPIKFTPSSSAPISVAGPGGGSALTLPGPAPIAASTGGGTAPLVGGLAKAPGSFLSRAGAFAEHNPVAAGMGLQGLGKLATLPGDIADRNLRQRQFDEEAEYRRRKGEALAPLIQMFIAQLQQNAGAPQYGQPRR